MTACRTAVLAVSVLLLASCSSASQEPTRNPTTSPDSGVSQAAPSTPITESSAPASEPPATTVESTPSGTPTFSSSEQAERWGAIVPAFEEYWDVINETYAAGGAAAPTDRMKETMTGGQLDYWAKTFADWKKQERKYEGKNQVTWATVTFTAIGSASGQASVEFCVDMSGTRAFESNGDALTKDGDFQKGIAGLEWVDNRWKTAGFKAGTGYVASC